MYIYTTKPKLGQYFNSLISTRVQQALGRSTNIDYRSRCGTFEELVPYYLTYV